MSPTVVRWFPSQEAHDEASPSHAIEFPPSNTKPPAADFPTKPIYGKSDGRTTARIDIKEGDSLYGVGRDHGAFLRNGQDFGGLPVGTPWVLCVQADGTAFGVLADTTYATGLNLSKAIEFTSDDPSLCIMVIRAPSPREVVVALNELTGRMEMPPLWALGYQQFSAYSLPQLELAARWLRDARIPASTLWLAVEKRGWPMSYPPDYVPDVPVLIKDMNGRGFRIVGVIAKGVPDVESGPLHEPGVNGGHFLKYQDGNLHREEVQGNTHLMPDFSRKSTREWWSGLVHSFLEPGLSGIVSIRWSPERLPAQVQVQADPELGGPDTGLRYQEVLDTQFGRAIRDGFDAEKANRRSFVTIDARAVGAQRYTGATIDWPDTSPDWPRKFLDATLNTALSGQPFLSTIVKPPFQGDGSEPNLRWIGVAATFPAVFGSFFLPQDLSTFPKDAEKHIRQAMERRAQLIPYLYTLCFGAFFSCEPIMQPLFFADPTNPELRASDGGAGFLIGNDLLVIPRLQLGPRPEVPLKGKWRRLDFGDSDNQLLPDLYIRPGAVIPLGPLVQYPDEKPVDPVTIVANPDENGLAEGFLYEDKGDGYEFYRNQARRIGYRVTREGDAFMTRLSALHYGLPLPTRKLHIRVLTDEGELTGQGSEKGTVKIPIPVSEKR